MKAFKVIDKDTRMGSNAAIFMTCCGEEKLMEVIREYSLRPYFPRYIRGSLVKKVPRSPGIMAFKTIEHAKKFQYRYALENRTIIVEVEGRPCKRQDRKIRNSMGILPKRFAKKGRSLSPPAPGTVFFDFVEVLQ